METQRHRDAETQRHRPCCFLSDGPGTKIMKRQTKRATVPELHIEAPIAPIDKAPLNTEMLGLSFMENKSTLFLHDKKYPKKKSLHKKRFIVTSSYFF